MVAPDSHRVSRFPSGTQEHGRSPSSFVYGTITLYGGPFQGPSPRGRVCNSFKSLETLMPVLQPPRDIGLQSVRSLGFGLFPFRSPLLREYFLFLGVLRCFSSPTYLCHAYVFSVEFSDFVGEGFPIRAPPAQPDRRLTEAFRSLSAPFIGSWRQGIHHGPLST